MAPAPPQTGIALMSCRPRFETYTGSSTPSPPPSKRRRPRCIYTLQTPICQATSIPPCTFQGRLVIVPRRGDPTHKETPQLICESHKRSQGPSSTGHIAQSKKSELHLGNHHRQQTSRSEPLGKDPVPLGKGTNGFLFRLKEWGA